MLFTHLSFHLICFLMVSHTVFSSLQFPQLLHRLLKPFHPGNNPFSTARVSGDTTATEAGVGGQRYRSVSGPRPFSSNFTVAIHLISPCMYIQLNILLSTTVHCTQSFSPRQVSFITWPVIFLLIFFILFSSVILFKQNICQDNDVIVMSENVSNQEVETPCVCGRKSTTNRPRYGVDPVIFKSNCHCTFWHNFWNSCFVSATHVIPCYTWVRSGVIRFSGFSV